MKKKFIISILMGIFLIQNIFAIQFDMSGYSQNYTGVLLKNGDYSISQNSFNLNLDYNSDKGKVHLNPVLYNENSSSNVELKLKESYFDLYFDNFDLRIGKQQIIWGKADGVFITDIISPKDLKEFILPDFDEIRIGINAVKLDYYIGDYTLETVFIPGVQGDILPSQDSIWTIKKTTLFSTATVDTSKLIMKESMKNSSVAIKLSSIGGFIDYELMTGYLWDSLPINSIYKNGTEIILQPEYYRNNVLGGSFSKTLSGLVLRGEGAIYINKMLQTEDILNGGKSKKNDLNYMIGIDYTFLGMNLSNQVIQEYILDYDEEIIKEELNTTLTFNINDKFFRDTLTCQLFAYYNINNEDMLIKPKIDYNLFDGFNIIIGGDLFVGDSGEFGQFNDNNMVYSKLKYSF